MQWFEKILKERFSSSRLEGKDSSLDGIDSSELWAQISESIPQQKVPNTPVLKWRLWSAILLVVLFTLGLLFFNNSSTKQPLTSNNTGESAPQKSNTAIVNIQKNENNSYSEKSDLGTNTIESIDPSFIINSTSNEIESDKALKKINSNAKADESITRVDISPGKTVNKPSNDVTIYDTNEIAASENQESKLMREGDSMEEYKAENESNTFNQKDRVAENNIKIGESLANEGILEKEELSNPKGNTENHETISKGDIFVEKLTQISPEHLKKESEFLIKSPLVEITKVMNSASPWSIKLSANVNTYNQTYKDVSSSEGFADEANQSVDSLKFGSGLGLYLGYDIDDNWSFATGVEINNYENQLNRVISTDSLIFETDIQKFRNYNFERTVKHTNKISAITIPLSISYDYSIGEKLGIGSAVGLSYSIVTFENVKVLGRNNTIIDFNDLQVNHFDNYLSFRINPYVRYRILDKIDLTLDFGFSRQSHGSSPVLDLTHRSSVFSVGLGVKYNFE